MQYVKSLSTILAVIVACATLAATSNGQERNRLLEWSKKFEDVRTRMRQVAVAGAAYKRPKNLRGRDKQGMKFHADLHELYEQTHRLYEEIRKSRKELDEKDYERVLQEYRQTIEEYQRATKELTNAARKSAEAARRSAEAKREAYKAAKEARENTKKQLASELEELTNHLDYEKGDEAVAVRSVALKAGPKTIGTVRRGEELSIEKVQEKWLWVRSGQTTGWIDSRSVMDAALFAWYQRLPSNASVEASGQTRAKFNDVMFEIIGAGSGPTRFINSSITLNGVPIISEQSAVAMYGNVGIVVTRLGNQQRALRVHWTAGRRTNLQEVVKGETYGTVEEGDYVFIHASARQVFVNGQFRRSR